MRSLVQTISNKRNPKLNNFTFSNFSLYHLFTGKLNNTISKVTLQKESALLDLLPNSWAKEILTILYWRNTVVPVDDGWPRNNRSQILSQLPPGISRCNLNQVAIQSYRRFNFQFGLGHLPWTYDLWNFFKKGYLTFLKFKTSLKIHYTTTNFSKCNHVLTSWQHKSWNFSWYKSKNSLGRTRRCNMICSTLLR